MSAVVKTVKGNRKARTVEGIETLREWCTWAHDREEDQLFCKAVNDLFSQLGNLRAERDDANKKLFDLSLDLNAMRAERDQLLAEKAQANFSASHPDVMKKMYRTNARLKEALEGDNLTAKRVYRLLEERDRLAAALEEIMSEVGTSTLAHKIARTAIGGEGGGHG